MNRSEFDLNLMVVFDAVMQEKNLTRAGRRLGLSQPAVSHALARLRLLLKDELFVRGPDGMLPTPRAERMAGPVRAALRALEVSLADDAFDPAQEARSFTIAANNYAARAVIPALARRVATVAPRVVLDVRPLGQLHLLDQLDDGGAELALGTLTEGGDRFKCAALLEDEYVALLAADNPVAAGPALTLHQFAGLAHIAITSSGDDTQFIDEALAARGLTRFVCARVPLHSLVLMLIGSGAVAVVPRRVAADLTAICPLILRPLPFPAPPVRLAMIWHRRLDNHPAHRWLRATLRASVTTLSPLLPPAAHLGDGAA